MFYSTHTCFPAQPGDYHASWTIQDGCNVSRNISIPCVERCSRISCSPAIMGVGRIFSRGEALSEFSKMLLEGGQKWWYLFFSYWKLRKQPFFAEIFKIQGEPCHPFRRPCLQSETLSEDFRGNSECSFLFSSSTYLHILFAKQLGHPMKIGSHTLEKIYGLLTASILLFCNLLVIAIASAKKGKF